MGTEDSNADAKHYQYKTQQQKRLCISQCPETIKKTFEGYYKQVHNSCGNDTTDSTIDHGPHIKRFGNIPAGGTNHLHGFYQETVAEHRQANRVIDQNNNDRRDQYRCDQ